MRERIGAYTGLMGKTWGKETTWKIQEYYVCIAVFNLDTGLLARSQYSEGPATGHLDTGFSWFPCVCKQMLRWFPRFQVATTCFSCSLPDLNLLVTNFIFCIHENNHCHLVTTQLQLIIIIIIIIRWGIIWRWIFRKRFEGHGLDWSSSG